MRCGQMKYCATPRADTFCRELVYTPPLLSALASSSAHTPTSLIAIIAPRRLSCPPPPPGVVYDDLEDGEERDEAFSEAALFVMPGCAPTAPPSNFQAAAVQPTSVMLHWDAVPGAEGYRLIFDEESRNDFAEVDLAPTMTSFTSRNLLPGGVHRFQREWRSSQRRKAARSPRCAGTSHLLRPLVVHSHGFQPGRGGTHDGHCVHHDPGHGRAGGGRGRRRPARSLAGQGQHSRWATEGNRGKRRHETSGGWARVGVGARHGGCMQRPRPRPCRPENSRGDLSPTAGALACYSSYCTVCRQAAQPALVGAG